MDLNELQSVRDRERQTDKLQQLRESFYADAGTFIQQLRTERERAVDRADDPFDSAEVQQLSDEIKTAQQTVEATYEKRVGKIVKAASFAAADLPTEVDGMTAEEQELFDRLVNNIKNNREFVLTLLDGEEPDASADAAPPQPRDEQGDSEERYPESSLDGHEPPGTEGGHAPDRGESPSQPSVSADGDNKHQDDSIDNDETQDRGEDGRQRGAQERVPAADVMGGDSEMEQQGGNASASSPEQDASPTGQATAAQTVPAEENQQQSVPAENATQQIREDGGQESKRKAESESPTSSGSPQHNEDGFERRRIQVVENVETFLGFDDRDYDLEPNDVVSLPATNADILLEKGVAREL